MVDRIAAANAATLNREFAWLSSVITTRLKLWFNQPTDHRDIRDLSPPDLSDDESVFASFCKHYRCELEERLILALSLVPHARPHLLDPFFVKNEQLDRGYSEFGGVRAQSHGGFLPTGETALFLLAGEDLGRRFACQTILDGDHIFAQHGVISLTHRAPGEPRFSGELTLAPDFVDHFSAGQRGAPAFNEHFPARRLVTNERWDDLVLESDVLEAVREIEAWIRHGDTLMHDWGFERRMRPGFCSLFYGPPGTGKTMTAALLGRHDAANGDGTPRQVFRVDLSMVVSKYIGETTKNLARVFDQAESRNWILFFDEADALFGRRSAVKDSHDRYANQEVAYLLQRVEDYQGVVILASNNKAGIDEAFARRFHSMIHFRKPRKEQRLLIWQKALDGRIELGPGTTLDELAESYDVAGGAIMNAVRYASLMALERGERRLEPDDLVRGIQRELVKEGRAS